MRVFQTFWTKPMDKEKLRINTYIAVLSLRHTQAAGYYVVMYTDTLGYSLLKDFGYDEINTELDNIPDDINPKFFAYPKFFAGMKEPLGSLHIDFDVFLKKPCVNKFFEDKSIDVILQCEEEYASFFPDYVDGRKIINLNEYPETFKVNHIHSSNVGIIGFNNKEFKDIYYSWYFDYIDFYKTRLNYLNGVHSELFAEQVNIDYLIQTNKYNCLYLLPVNTGSNHQEISDYADTIGYQHLQGTCKYKSKTMDKIKETLNKKFPGTLEKIEILFNEN